MLVKEKLTINEKELLTLLMNVNKPTFTHIVSKTIPTMNKKSRVDKTPNPYFNEVTKITKGNYFIGGNYEDMVNTRCEKEGIEPTFESEECKVGHHVTKCVQYNEKTELFYLQYFTFQTSNIKSEMYFRGNVIDRQLLESYLQTYSESSRQPQENKHDVKSFKISSIEEITLGGIHYIVER